MSSETLIISDADTFLHEHKSFEEEAFFARRISARLPKVTDTSFTEEMLEVFKNHSKLPVGITFKDDNTLLTALNYTIEPIYTFEEDFTIREKIEELRWAIRLTEARHNERLVGLKDPAGKNLKLEPAILEILVWNPEQFGMQPTDALRLFRKLSGEKFVNRNEESQVSKGLYAAPERSKLNIPITKKQVITSTSQPKQIVFKGKKRCNRTLQKKT